MVCMPREGASRLGCFALSFIYQAAGPADAEGLEASVDTWEYAAIFDKVG